MRVRGPLMLIPAIRQWVVRFGGVIWTVQRMRERVRERAVRSAVFSQETEFHDLRYDKLAVGDRAHRVVWVRMHDLKACITELIERSLDQGEPCSSEQLLHEVRLKND